MDYLLGLFSSSTIFQVRARWITRYTGLLSCHPRGLDHDVSKVRYQDILTTSSLYPTPCAGATVAVRILQPILQILVTGDYTFKPSRIHAPFPKPTWCTTTVPHRKCASIRNRFASPKYADGQHLTCDPVSKVPSGGQKSVSCFKKFMKKVK
jgi:hypothetical protein